MGTRGGLHENDPHRPLQNGTVRKLDLDLVGVSVSLLEKVCHRGWALRFQQLKPSPVPLFFLLPTDLEELLATCPAPCLTMCFMLPDRDDNGLNL